MARESQFVGRGGSVSLREILRRWTPGARRYVGDVVSQDLEDAGDGFEYRGEKFIALCKKTLPLGIFIYYISRQRRKKPNQARA